jgi:hypothetical protein
MARIRGSDTIQGLHCGGNLSIFECHHFGKDDKD